MKVLILANGTGGGHLAAAAALEESFRKKGHDAEVLDPFSLLGGLRGRATSSFINNLYIRSVQFAPKLFAFTYKLGEIYWRVFKHRQKVKSPVYYANYSCWKPLERLFIREQYDAVITTHLYPGEMLAGMKEHGMFVPESFWVSTDYNCIPFTNEAKCDHYVIGHEQLIKEYTEWGIPEEELYPLGIPVKEKFRTDMTRDEAKELLGLEKDKHYFLIAGGSVGSGKLVEAVTLLFGKYLNRDDVEFVAICGNNEFTYKQMKKLFSSKVRMLQHTDQMAEYMRACDAIISKPGGLSSTEAAVTGTALIFISPIPGGPEVHNIAFFQKNGMAVYAESVALELRNLVEEILSDEKRISTMVARQHQTVHADASEQIVALVERKVTERDNFVP